MAVAPLRRILSGWETRNEMSTNVQFDVHQSVGDGPASVSTQGKAKIDREGIQSAQEDSQEATAVLI